MLIFLTVFSGVLFILVMTFAAVAADQRDNAKFWIAVANTHVDTIIMKNKEIKQHELIIALLMDRELAGTWLPNVDAEIPGDPISTT